MGNTIQTKQDIRNALLTVGHATLAAQNAQGGPVSEYAQGYQEGVKQALIAVALALGLAPTIESTTPGGPPGNGGHPCRSVTGR